MGATVGRPATGGRVRRRAIVAGIGVSAAILLSACNPISQPAVDPDRPGRANASVTYHGPTAWLQVSIRGTEGYGVTFKAGVPGVPPRTCAEATTGAPTPCEVVGDYLASSWHYPANGASAAWWPTVQIRDGEWASILLDCSYATVAVPCPASARIVARTVDDHGELVGDLDEGIVI